MRRITSKLAILLLALSTLLTAIPAQAVIHNIDVGNFFFSPTKTQVCPGDTVRWTWVGGVHSTTSDPSSPKTWDSGTSGTNGHTFELEFLAGDGPGPFPYHCSVHALTMKDTIFVAIDCPPGFVCGDANASAQVDIDDVVFLIAYIFQGGPAPTPLEAGDANCSGGIDIDDVVYLIAYIFQGGPVPCATC